MLKLTRPLVVLDVESTGKDPATDAIFFFGAMKLSPDEATRSLSVLIKPWKPISKEVEELTGTTNAMVADCNPFTKSAKTIMEWMADCDLGGFNLSNFDVPILWEEFYRAGLRWDLSGINIVDAGTLFKIREPRDLTAARLFYAGKPHLGAHKADLSDVEATIDVITGQLSRYPDLQDKPLSELAAASKYEDERRVDLAGKIVLDNEGQPIYNFSKNKGVRVLNDIGFARWMLRENFSQETKMVLRRILDGDNNQTGLFE